VAASRGRHAPPAKPLPLRSAFAAAEVPRFARAEGELSEKRSLYWRYLFTKSRQRPWWYLLASPSMREPAKILNLASALAALVAPAAAPPVANAADSDESAIATEAEHELQSQTETRAWGDVELMSFTVNQTSDGMPFPQHQSHSSHVSHASHVSGSIPWPDPNPVPVPIPAPAPAPAAPAPAADPAALACARAVNGLGVKDIAYELQQVYGLDTNAAVSIAQQALTAVLTGGHFCDAYLGQ